MALPPPDPEPKGRKGRYSRFVKKSKTPVVMKTGAVPMPKYQAKAGYKDAPGGTRYKGQISYDNQHNTRKV